MKHLLLLIAFFACSTIQMHAQKSNDALIVADMQAYGYATSLNDSVIYVTEIMKLPVARVDRKNGFLSKRADYSNQLKDYMKSIGVEHATCAIVFNRNKVKLNKIFIKMLAKAQKKKHYVIKTISEQEFSFKDPMIGM
ncbi:MAG: hypothetical protein MJZ32_07125 [Bacteroidaceae bacterium]|nr:hypothetical protein [Bacteroidaceae bacterium]